MNNIPIRHFISHGRHRFRAAFHVDHGLHEIEVDFFTYEESAVKEEMQQRISAAVGRVIDVRYEKPLNITGLFV